MSFVARQTDHAIPTLFPSIFAAAAQSIRIDISTDDSDLSVCPYLLRFRLNLIHFALRTMNAPTKGRPQYRMRPLIVSTSLRKRQGSRRWGNVHQPQVVLPCDFPSSSEMPPGKSCMQNFREDPHWHPQHCRRVQLKSRCWLKGRSGKQVLIGLGLGKRRSGTSLTRLRSSESRKVIFTERVKPA